MLALENVRVIDLTEALAGPYCTMILGDLGADVVKVERPIVGDQSRKWGPPFIGTESAYFLSVNRNKRSIELDIKSADGKVAMRNLLETADVFICNVRKLESLIEVGLDPDTVRAYNPRLIYCSITAYGRTGPYADRAGYDLVAQGESGLMAATGQIDGEPMRWPVAIADLSSGIWSATAILTALYVRERTGYGQLIDQSLLDGQLSWAAVMAGQYFATGERPARLGNRHANIVPYQVFKASDKYLIVAVGTPVQWRRFCDSLDLSEAIRDDLRYADNAARLKNREQLCEIIESVLVSNTAEYWLARLRLAEIPAGPVNALDEALADPQVLHRNMVVKLEHPSGELKVLGNPLHFSDTKVAYRRRPPLLGEHTTELLEQLVDRSHTSYTLPAGIPLTAVDWRLPRYVSQLPVRFGSVRLNAPATTINLSDGGCAVRFTGQSPRVGDEVTLSVCQDEQSAETRAIVRWVRETNSVEKTVGLEVVRNDVELRTWRALIATVARSGARAA